MKIGLILSHRGINYGMFLQAYATQVYIESKGFETEIIEIKETKNFSNRLKKYFRYLSPVALKSALMKAKRRKLIKNNPVLKQAFVARSEEGKNFVENRLHNIKVFKSFEEAHEYSKNNYSCVMIGSDQQWAPACFYSKLNTLMFVPEGVKRASYATSMGVSNIPANTHSLLKSFISRMDYISVREKTGRDIITKVTGREDVRIVPDPTFLLTSDEWEKHISKRRLENSDYIFCYFLGNSDIPVKKVILLAKKLGKNIIFVRNVESYSSKQIDYEDSIVVDAPSVEDFVNYIRYASLVCTDSFHCTVFSIINNVDFVSFYRTEKTNKDSRNSRIDDLLYNLECQNRICEQDGDLSSVVACNIDFENVNKIVESTRSIGEDFLKEILHE